MLPTIGARRVQCIKVLGGSKRKTASVGDTIVVSVKEAIPRGRVKGDVMRAVIVRTARKFVVKMAALSALTAMPRFWSIVGRAYRHPYFWPGDA